MVYTQGFEGLSSVFTSFRLNFTYDRPVVAKVRKDELTE